MFQPKLAKIITQFEKVSDRADVFIDFTADRLATNAKLIDTVKGRAARSAERLGTAVDRVFEVVTRFLTRISVAAHKRLGKIEKGAMDTLDRIDTENANLINELNRATRIRDRVEDFLNEVFDDEAKANGEG